MINFYRKSVPDINFSYQSIKELTRVNFKQINIFNCWEEEVGITPGQLSDIGGKYAIKSLTQAVQALKEGKIHGLVTAPIHKRTHIATNLITLANTYLKHIFGVQDVAMLMVAGNFRVGLLSEHVPVSEAAKYVTRDNILSKLSIINNSLIKDFGIDKPKVAVLGLNPHAGDEGLIGREEEEIIKPAIKDARHFMLAMGPYSADGFFARRHYEKFDAVLAMYHDQGLIPFKSLAIGEGVNYTAGLPVVRTSPDHGTAFDIAGKNKADHSSFLTAIFECIDIIERRQVYVESHRNPVKKVTPAILANVEDEKIEEDSTDE